MEIAGNMTTSRVGAAGNPELDAIREELYLAEAARLATSLTPTELMAVAWAYSLVSAGATALATLCAGGGRKADDPERAILEQVVATITPTTTLLTPRVWSAKERVALERAVPSWREKESLQFEEGPGHGPCI
jgi:hypothetical protein